MTHTSRRRRDPAQLVASPIQYIGLLGPRSRGESSRRGWSIARALACTCPIGSTWAARRRRRSRFSIVSGDSGVFERRSACCSRAQDGDSRDRGQSPTCAVIRRGPWPCVPFRRPSVGRCGLEVAFVQRVAVEILGRGEAERCRSAINAFGSKTSSTARRPRHRFHLPVDRAVRPAPSVPAVRRKSKGESPVSCG